MERSDIALQPPPGDDRLRLCLFCGWRNDPHLWVNNVCPNCGRGDENNSKAYAQQVAALTAQVADLQAKLSLAAEALQPFATRYRKMHQVDPRWANRAMCPLKMDMHADSTTDEDGSHHVNTHHLRLAHAALTALTALAPAVAEHEHEQRLKDLEGQAILDTLCENLPHFRESWNSITGMDDGTHRWLMAALALASERLKRQGAAEALERVAEELESIAPVNEIEMQALSTLLDDLSEFLQYYEDINLSSPILRSAVKLLARVEQQRSTLKKQLNA